MIAVARMSQQKVELLVLLVWLKVLVVLMLVLGLMLVLMLVLILMLVLMLMLMLMLMLLLLRLLIRVFPVIPLRRRLCLSLLLVLAAVAEFEVDPHEAQEKHGP